MIIKDIIEEIRAIATGKTVDTLIPPGLYFAVQKPLGIETAVGLSVLSAVLLLGLRLYQKNPWQYVVAGLIGVILAGGFAIFSNSAVSYYVPELLTSLAFVAAVWISLFIKKPLAAWISHITRGWPLEWFWRQDVKPAYTEVTFFWFLLLILRSGLFFVLLLDNNLNGLFLINTLLGLPATLVVLALSYAYGIWRLRRLGGPGVEEFQSKVPAPWRGQTKGF